MGRHNSESALYEQIATWLNLKYPGIVYHFDLSGVHNASPVSRGLYSRLNGRGFPDLVIYHPAELEGEHYCGLALELKVDGARLTKREGDWASPHIEEQVKMLDRLAEAGFLAMFVSGFDAAAHTISLFMGKDTLKKLVDTSEAF